MSQLSANPRLAALQQAKAKANARSQRVFRFSQVFQGNNEFTDPATGVTRSLKQGNTVLLGNGKNALSCRVTFESDQQAIHAVAKFNTYRNLDVCIDDILSMESGMPPILQLYFNDEAPSTTPTSASITAGTMTREAAEVADDASVH
jgi:hypothetical protein